MKTNENMEEAKELRELREQVYTLIQEAEKIVNETGEYWDVKRKVETMLRKVEAMQEKLILENKKIQKKYTVIFDELNTNFIKLVKYDLQLKKIMKKTQKNIMENKMKKGYIFTNFKTLQKRNIKIQQIKEPEKFIGLNILVRFQDISKEANPNHYIIQRLRKIVLGGFLVSSEGTLSHMKRVKKIYYEI